MLGWDEAKTDLCIRSWLKSAWYLELFPLWDRWYVFFVLFCFLFFVFSGQ